MENSYRVIWEIDVDAADAHEAARAAASAFEKGLAPVFEVHQWDEPDMVTATPVALVDIRDPEAELPVPGTRHFRDQYLGPQVI